MRGVFAGLFIALAMPCTFSAVAQSYPSPSLRVAVGTLAGVGGDVIARVLGGGLTPLLGQQVTIDYRPGAVSNSAAEIVAKSPADGRPVFLGSITHAVNVSFYPNLPFDLTRDFSAVMQLASSPQVMVVHPLLPVKTPKDIVSALHGATMTAPGNAEIAWRLGALGYVVVGDTPEEFMTFIRRESDALGTVVKALNLKSEQD